MSFLLMSLGAGIAATLAMDAVALIGTKLGFLSKPNLALLGRWLVELLHGRPVRSQGDIRSARQWPYERLLGAVAHYAIGSFLAGIYLYWRHLDPDLSPIVSALTFGIATSGFPWLLMFPSMGFGFFASKAPQEAHLLRTSFFNHLAYGIGLFMAGLFLVS